VFRQGRIICNRLTSQTNPQEIVGLITGAIDPASLSPERAKITEETLEETV
jgi:fructose transport system ATP-binding protein